MSAAITTSPIESASDAGLIYVTDADPGISRIGGKSRFRYRDSHGRLVHDPNVLSRIRSLVIPPNWNNVWICRNAKGHLQATGRDARNRKQYRYHPSYRAVREQNKYEKMIAFGTTLPMIRRHVEQHLSLPGLPKEKVLATVVRLMDLAQIRVGNEEYARQNQSFGLTTMRDRHVEIAGGTLHFQFRGKSGKLHTIDLQDRRLASIVKRCRDLPGYELFQYMDPSGGHVSVDSGMVNQYLRDTSREDITAKDFRTWHGTVYAAVHLAACGPGGTANDVKRNVVEAIKAVSEHLGNRPATCRKYYVHPRILELYGSGKLTERMSEKAHAHNLHGLSREERCVLGILRACSGVEK